MGIYFSQTRAHRERQNAKRSIYGWGVGVDPPASYPGCARPPAGRGLQTRVIFWGVWLLDAVVVSGFRMPPGIAQGVSITGRCAGVWLPDVLPVWGIRTRVPCAGAGHGGPHGHACLRGCAWAYACTRASVHPRVHAPTCEAHHGVVLPGVVPRPRGPPRASCGGPVEAPVRRCLSAGACERPSVGPDFAVPFRVGAPTRAPVQARVGRSPFPREGVCGGALGSLFPRAGACARGRAQGRAESGSLAGFGNVHRFDNP